MRKMILFLSALLLAATASVAFAANCDAMNGAWKASKLPRYNDPDVIDVAKGLYSPANDRGGANVSPFSYKCIGENLFQFDGSMTRQYTLSADGVRAKSVFKNLNSGFTMVEDDMVKVANSSANSTNQTAELPDDPQVLGASASPNAGKAKGKGKKKK